MRRANFSLALAVVLLVIGILQWVRPFSAAPVSPVLLVIAALLLMARYALARQRMKREQMLDQIPKHPLGISDDD
jgi:hypothetical protein